MELYILDSLLRRTVVIDRFESMIWTERYSDLGDFELIIFSTLESRTLLQVGTRLSMSDSYRVMTIEFVENTIDSEGRQLLTVKGRSLEAILEDRVARNTFSSLSTTPKWILTGTPGGIARQIFNEICRTNVNFPDDQIPFLQLGSIFPPSNILEPSDVITVELELSTVHKAIKEICDTYDLGFRLVRNFDLSELYFDIYSGSDRTTLQNVLAPVVFSPDLDNLTNTSEITSISTYKNVAYVFHTYGVQIVTADGVSVEVEGFDRRVLTVDASDISLPERTYTLTEEQANAIDVYIARTDALLARKDALQKVKERKRLTPAEETDAMAAVLNPGLTAPQKAAITAANTTNISATSAENALLVTLLQQRGRDELAKNRSLSAFDGEISNNSVYKYNSGYNLGDLVEMRNSDGATNQMRVTEQIFVSDNEGERSYPTLTIDLFITPGSWFAWDYNQVWQDADGTWSEA